MAQQLPQELLEQVFEAVLLAPPAAPPPPGAELGILDPTALRALPRVCVAWAQAFRSGRLYASLLEQCFLPRHGTDHAQVGPGEHRQECARATSGTALIWGDWTQGGGSDKGSAVQVSSGGVRSIARTSRSSFAVALADGALRIVAVEQLGQARYRGEAVEIAAPEPIAQLAAHGGTGPRGDAQASKLGQLQPFVPVSPQECLGKLASFGPT